MTTCSHTWSDDGTRVSCQRDAVIRVGWPFIGKAYCEKHAGKHAPVSKYS